METRALGVKGPALSAIGLGAWAIGGSWEFGWGPVDDGESIRTIHRALDLGINWIDTAAVYGLGHSESIVGRAIRERRDRVFIATKCGMVWDKQNTVGKNLRPESIRKELEASLRRLGTDHVDLYQFHWPDPETPIEDSWRTMSELVAEGKTRHIGVCNFSVAQLDRCREIAPVQSLQPPYSMLKREIEIDLLPYCVKHQIGVIAYSPLASGLLTGKFDAENLAQDDWRRKSARFGSENVEKVRRLLKQLKPIADQHRTSVAGIAIAWILKNEHVTSAIVGARKPWQIEETVIAADVTLSPADIASIEEILQP